MCVGKQVVVGVLNFGYYLMCQNVEKGVYGSSASESLISVADGERSKTIE